MSAVHPKADMKGTFEDVRFVPLAAKVQRSNLMKLMRI